MAMTYLHSHVHTDIVDNSVITSVSDGGTVGFFPIFSDKGKENELVLIDGDVRTFVDTYGTDGVKFGQAQLNVRQWLLGGGSAYVMRLLPDDATYASAAVVVNVDSYMPIYKLTVSLKDPSNLENVLPNTLRSYFIEEGFIQDGSTIKELKICNEEVYFKDHESEHIFRTGRGKEAEEKYDFNEDWMRQNDLVVEDTKGDPDEETGLLPVKSYINYNLITNFGKYFKPGTKAFSPGFTDSLIKGMEAITQVNNNLKIVVEYNGKTDFIYKKTGEEVFILKFADGEAKYYHNSDINDDGSIKEEAEPVKASEVTFAKLLKEDYSTKEVDSQDMFAYDQENDVVLDLYKAATEDLYIVNTNNIEYNVESEKFENAYAPLTGEDKTRGKSIKEHEFLTSGLTVNILDKLNAILIAPFGDDPDTGDVTTCGSLKEMLFSDSGNIHVYYSFEETKIPVTVIVDGVSKTEEKSLSELINVKLDDLAYDTQYFLDSYPIEVYSTFNSKSETKKIWNAKITVTDSDGKSKDIKIFRDELDNKRFTLEDHVYYALNALCKDRGTIYEPKRGDYFTEGKSKGNTNNDYFHARFTMANGTFGIAPERREGEVDTAEKGVRWLNKEDLSSSVYAGNYAFTRKDADKVTVELYTPNKNACKTLDGIKLNIYNYCTLFNNTITNLLKGKKKYPIGYFVSNCRGEYYNNMKIYLKLNDELKDTYPDFRLYDLEVYDCANDKTQLIDGPYTVSFYKDAVDTAGGSLYIKSILDTYGKKDANGDIAVNFYDDVDQDVFSDLSKDLSSLFRLKHPKFVFSNAAVDPFFVPQVDENILSQGDPDYEYHSYMAYTDDETVPEDQRSLRIQGDNNISTATSLRLDEGFFLANGSSGTLFDKKGNLIQSAYRKLMVQAYNGGLNPHVFDIRNYEFDVILDAKFPKAVKIAMVQLASSLRRDCIVCLDTDNMLSNTSGPATSAQAAIEARKSINTNDYAASIWCQNSVAYDEYTDRDIPVSATYFLSYKIPFNDKANGIQTAFVGPRRGTMDLYKEFDWYPTEAEKERLYKAQINYVSKDPRRIAFDSQLTSQVVTSALSNIPNVRVLFKIKRAVEKICDDYRFERNNGGTRVDMEDQVNEYLKSWVNNGACETCTATVTASDYQIKQKMAQVAIDVVFVGFLERIHIVINVNG